MLCACVVLKTDTFLRARVKRQKYYIKDGVVVKRELKERELWSFKNPVYLLHLSSREITTSHFSYFIFKSQKFSTANIFSF